MTRSPFTRTTRYRKHKGFSIGRNIKTYPLENMCIPWDYRIPEFARKSRSTARLIVRIFSYNFRFFRATQIRSPETVNPREWIENAHRSLMVYGGEKDKGGVLHDFVKSRGITRKIKGRLHIFSNIRSSEHSWTRADPYVRFLSGYRSCRFDSVVVFLLVHADNNVRDNRCSQRYDFRVQKIIGSWNSSGIAPSFWTYSNTWRKG